VLRNVNILHSGGRHPLTTSTKLKILIFGVDESSIRPLDTISCNISCRAMQHHANISSDVTGKMWRAKHRRGPNEVATCGVQDDERRRGTPAEQLLCE